MNEIANLCERVGANIQDVAKHISYDGRIGSSGILVCSDKEID